jgi:hypothetical protein
MLAAHTGAAFAPYNYRISLAFSDEFLWNGFLGGVTNVHIMRMARLPNSYERKLAIREYANGQMQAFLSTLLTIPPCI